MTHKERLLAAINHEEPDRVPLCAWYTPEAEKMLLRHLGVNSDQTETYKAAGGPLPILMDHDFLISWVGPCTSYYADPKQEHTKEGGSSSLLHITSSQRSPSRMSWPFMAPPRIMAVTRSANEKTLERFRYGWVPETSLVGDYIPNELPGLQYSRTDAYEGS